MWPYLSFFVHLYVCVPLYQHHSDYCAIIRSVVEIILRKFMSRYHGNKVLMGDLNTEPYSHTIR